MKKKRSLRSVQTLIEKNRAYAKKLLERCETCLKWDGKKCMKAKPPRGCGPDGAMEPTDCCLGWISKDGKREHRWKMEQMEQIREKPMPEKLPEPVDLPPIQMPVKPAVYVILAKRYGCNERHSYVVGARNTLGEAQTLAETHEIYRGGKYLCEITCCPLTETSEDFLPPAIRDPEPTQPEPMIGEYLCRANYKCSKWKKGKKE